MRAKTPQPQLVAEMPVTLYLTETGGTLCEEHTAEEECSAYDHGMESFGYEEIDAVTLRQMRKWGTAVCGRCEERKRS